MIRKLITCIGISLLVACSQEAEELAVPTDSIQFGVENVSDTRGIVISGETGSNPLTSMSVFCAYTDKQEFETSTILPNWMFNVRVARKNISEKWIINDPKQPNAPTQWAGDGYHTFFAFAPYSESISYYCNTNRLPSFRYKISQNHKEHIDLLYSHKTLLNGRKMYIGGRPVNFGFSHALTKITFAAKKDISIKGDVQINSVSLIVQKHEGEFKIELTGEYPQMVRAMWEPKYYEEFKPYTLSIANGGLKKMHLPESDFTLLHAPDSALFMLPQGIYSNGFKIECDYSIIQPDGEIINKTASFILFDTTTIRDWYMGQAYRYSILIKEEEATINGTLSKWNDRYIIGDPKATFLTLSHSEITLKRPTNFSINYETDGSRASVVVSHPGIKYSMSTYPQRKVNLEITQDAPPGVHYVYLTVDKITRKINVTVI